MNDHGPTIQGDANSSALLSHQRRQDKADLAYEEREASAPSDIYEDEAREMIIEALTGGKDDIDIIGCLVQRFERDCTSLDAIRETDFRVVCRIESNVVCSTPDHLGRLVQWTVRDCIKKWVDFQTKKYAEDVL